jgi:transcriptional regulator with XRE-family HTH domain
MADSLGARLRHERERRQIALRSIAESTKISLPMLEGLERDNVSRWPSGIFRKSFVRAYAQALGLDPEPIVREFEERYPDPLQAAAQPQEPTGALPETRADKTMSRGWLELQRCRSWARARANLAVSQGRRTLRIFNRRDALVELRPLVVRFTINSADSAFTRGKLLGNIRKRWAAAAYDAGVSCTIALGLFPLIGHFWTPLGVSMLCYYFGGILILGNTPGVCLFAPKSAEPRGARVVDRRDRESSVPVRG